MGSINTMLWVCTALAYIYEYTRVPTRQGPKKSKCIFFVLMTVFICFGGFRGQYNDTWTYRDVYTFVTKPFPTAWETISWKLGESPAFQLVSSFLKTYDVEVHLYLFFFFFWTTIFYMSFVKRYTVNFPLSIYFFFTMGNYTFNMAAIKQCIATAFVLAAMPLAVEKKWVRYWIVVIFSAFFHPFVLMYLLVPFMGFRPWSKWTFMLLVSILIGGLLFEPMVGTIVDLTTAIGKNYSVEGLTGEGIKMLRLLVVWSPVVLSFVYRDVLFRDCPREERIFVNLTMAYAGILLMGRFGTALYFGRLSNYFSMMPVLSLPWMLQKITKHNPRDGNFITAAAVFGYFVFFYFSNTLETLFSTSYAALTPIAFFKILVAWLSGRFA